MLGVWGLEKRYGRVVALSGVDLEIAPGEICGLLGPNGAGKTTLVSIISGLRRPDAGSIWVNGVDALANPYEARRFIGLAPQELGIYASLTVRQNLTFMGELAGLRGEVLRKEVDRVAEAMELTALLSRKSQAMSGGEKRRLHTAMAMLHRPRLLLLDEPTAGVDVHTRARLLEAVRTLATEDGTSVCYSTHYLPEIEALGASIAIIDRGRLVVRGNLQQLIQAHGRSGFELTFEGRPPRLDVQAPYEIQDNVLRIFDDDPAGASAAVIGSLSPRRRRRLRGVEIITPSLESVFLSMTGRRYSSEQETTLEVSGERPA